MDPDGAASGSAVTEDAPDLSVVMPVYNEGEAVEPVLRALDSAVRTPHEILVVYDFDGDTTVPVIVRLTPEIDGLRGLRNDLGRGVLNAMKAGLAEARGSYLLISMADGSDDPACIDSMVELARSGADVVAGSRYMRGGRQIGGPPLKRLMSRVAGLTLHWFAGVATHDAPPRDHGSIRDADPTTPSGSRLGAAAGRPAPNRRAGAPSTEDPERTNTGSTGKDACARREPSRQHPTPERNPGSRLSSLSGDRSKRTREPASRLVAESG